MSCQQTPRDAKEEAAPDQSLEMPNHQRAGLLPAKPSFLLTLLMSDGSNGQPRSFYRIHVAAQSSKAGKAQESSSSKAKQAPSWGLSSYKL